MMSGFARYIINSLVIAHQEKWALNGFNVNTTYIAEAVLKPAIYGSTDATNSGLSECSY